MSKLMWKSLIISPAVLGAMLLVAAGRVGAADSSNLFTANNRVSQEASQLQTAEVQAPEVQSQELDTTFKSDLTSVVAPTAPVAQNTTVLSTTATQASVEPKVGEVEVPASNKTVAQVTQAVPTNPDNVLDPINQNSPEDNSSALDQVTNVSQLRDVSPGDWAYEALRSLVERYGCIAGYPDGTFRGNRATTRYEFAAGLNACLNQVERLITSSTEGFVRRQDLETLQRLVSEFRTELTALGGRVDRLEGRTAFLEERQFSTTTKLQGEAIFALTDEFNQAVSNNTVFQNRVRLSLNTSFTGRDRLLTRLSAGNALAFAKPDAPVGFFDGDPLPGFPDTAEGNQTFNITRTTNNSINLDKLEYFFNFGSSKVVLSAFGGNHRDYVPTLNPYFDDDDGGNGALSTFASYNPIYRIGGGSGAAISLGVGPLQSILGPSTLTVGYLAGPGANDPSDKNGLFNGNYSALGQLNFNLGDRIGVGLTYVHAYHNSNTDIFNLGDTANGSRVVGTTLANNPSNTNFALPFTPVVTNSYGTEVAFRLSNNISLSGFATFTKAILINQGTGDIWTYGGGVAFSDFGKKGNILGLFAGVEPTLRGLSPGVRPTDGFPRDIGYHLEGFYKYQLTDNISLTPGVIWITNPNQNRNNDDILIGTLRTTFTF
ncbi:MAG TPA: iron uptake porin [Candidatus Sericytochromatia bacterium]